MRRTVVLGIAGVAVVPAAATGAAFAVDAGRPTSAATTSAVTTAATTEATTDATTDATTETTPHPTSPGAKARKHPRGEAESRALHGTFTIERRGAPAVVDVQRGTVTAVDPGSITVRSTDGFSATYGITSTTKIRKDRKAATTADVPVGTKVGILADDVGGHPTARTVRVLPKL